MFIRGFGTSEGIEWGLWLAITVYWIVELDLSLTQLALLGVALESAVIVSETPTGVVADVKSRKWSLIIGQVLMGGSFAWTFAVENIWMLLASHALLGVGWTFQSGADAAWITDEVAGQRRGDASSLNEPDTSGNDVEQLLLKRGRVGMALSLVVGPVTILLGWWQSVRFVGLALSVAFILVAVWLAFAMSEEHFTPGSERGVGFSQTLRDGVGVIRDQPRLRTLVLVAALLFAGAEIFGRIGPVHFLDSVSGGEQSSGESLFALGVLFMLIALAGLVLNTVASKRLDRDGNISHVAGVLLLIAALGGVLASSTSLIALVGIGFLLQDAVQESMYPVMEGWANRDAPTEVRATVHSLVGQTTSISQIAGAIVLGALAQATSVQVGLGAATILIGIAALVALRPGQAP